MSYYGALYGWLDKESQANHSLIITVVESFGIAIGSVLAGFILNKGRKLAVMVGLILVAVGSIDTFFRGWWLYIGAKVVVALGIGIT